MDDKQFDTITQALATDGSRRRLLGGLVGGVAAVLTGAATLEAKRGGKGRGRGRGQSNGGGQGAGTAKVQICHRTNGKKGFTLITVGAPAVPAHERHGDAVCEQLACQTVTGCAVNAETDELECVSEPLPANTECVTDEGVAGLCDNGGNCVADDGGGAG